MWYVRPAKAQTYSMLLKLLTKRHLELLSLKGGRTGSSGSRLAKCHIVGNHMSRLNYVPAHENFARIAHVVSRVPVNMQTCPNLHYVHTQNMLSILSVTSRTNCIVVR